MIVRSVTGDLNPARLGHTQCHEHLFIERGPSFQVTPVLLMEDLEKTVAELLDYHRVGGTAVVDAQPGYCGRMAGHLVASARRTGVTLIASTGFHKAEFYEPDCPLFSMSVDAVTDFFVREIELGMIPALCESGNFPSGRAGIVKVALASEGPCCDRTGGKLLEAAVLAAKATGAAVLCHTDPEIRPMEHIGFMTRLGLSTNRIILSHLDRTCHDWQILQDTLNTGVLVTFDTIHRYKYRDDLSERRLITDLVHAGFARQVMLALDTTNRRLRHYGGEIGLDYILCSFLQTLRQDGLADSDLYQMTTANAARVLPLQPEISN